MEETLIRKIKRVVANNFDSSFVFYDEFEQRYGFFAELTLKLAEFVGLSEGSSVLDLGCGSGVSAEVLTREFGCEVVGIDLSEKMVAHGRKVINDPRIRLEVGDAAAPESVVGEKKFDSVVYNASIFIIPEAEKSLKRAVACLKPGGSLGFSFYPELVADDGSNLFHIAFSRCNMPRPERQVITSYREALSGLRDCCEELQEGVYEKPFSEEFLVDFFSIPAQSASLFPRLDYKERRQKVEVLFATLRPEAEGAKIIWRLAAGWIKKRMSRHKL